MGRTWTDAQKQCLDAKGTVLVSAAAGSGKTTVLVERVLRLITGEDPVDVDSLLIVTFTNAAAAQMKQKLTEKLQEAVEKDPKNARLRRQLMILPDADICTVHGFCGRLIRENFHLIDDLSPAFRIGKPAQVAGLREDALQEVLEEAYGEEMPGLDGLLELIGGKRGDRLLAERIEKLYELVQAQPFPDVWLDAAVSMYETDLPPEKTPWGKEIVAAVTEELEWYEFLYDRLLKQLDGCEELAGYAAMFLREQEMIRNCRAAIAGQGWDEIRQTLQALSFGRLPMVKDCTVPDLKEQAQNVRNKKIKVKAVALWEWLEDSAEQASADLAAVRPGVQALCTLTRRFAARFSAKKRERDVLDFNDMEHLALELLICRTGDSETPTPLAAQVAERYRYVMVDEYQDTNPTQERLFRAVSRNEENLFYVGDVKQSIYAFRNATPQAFVERRDVYAPYDGKTYPAVIRLEENFRSRQSVTDVTNFVFSQLMTRESSDIDYDGGEALKAAASYAPKDNDAAELWLLDTASGEEDSAGEVQQARLIADRIGEMKARMTVKDGDDGERALEYGDICILLRSTKGRASQYVEELNRRGIPAVSDTGAGFYTSPEIVSVISLLRFLDNPMQDIALLAVLASPSFAFTPDDLAEIRLAAPRVSVYTALRRRARERDALGERCGVFLRQTDGWRREAAVIGADRLIVKLYGELSLPAIAAARPHGAGRQANLRKFLDIAREFEDNGYRGLSAFVRFLDRECARQDREAPAPVAGENAVHIMSIHASKGLEFPVVFLAGLGHRFNDQDSRDALRLHRTLGIGIDVWDGEHLEKHTPFVRKAMAWRTLRDARAEELRILYVAMTRAKERLCMIMSGNVGKLTASAAEYAADTGICAGAVFRASSFAQWLLMALMRHPDAAELRRIAQIDAAPLDHSGHLDVTVTVCPGQEEPPQTAAEPCPPDQNYLDALKIRGEYIYPYAALSAVPAKAAVSALTHGGAVGEFTASSRPAFMAQAGLTPAERGTALHRFMQFAEYERAAADVKAEAARLVREGFLSDAEGRALPVDRLEHFFSGDLYRRIARANVKREYAFSAQCPAARFLPDAAEVTEGESVLIQGIADCLFEEPDGWVIVDYKTDRVATAQELRRRYQTQVALYAEYIGKRLDKPIKECLLYSFWLQTAVRV